MRGLPSALVVKTLPALKKKERKKETKQNTPVTNSWDMGSVSDPGRFHMPYNY